MPKPENWILVKVHANQKLDIPKTKIPHHKTCGFLSRRLKNLLMDSFAYAFISSITEPYFKVAIGKSDEAFEKRVLNVIKRTFLKELVLEVFRKGGLGYGRKGYLEPYPYSKP